MSKIKILPKKKKLNVLALVSLLMVILVPPLLLIPWNRLFILRSDSLSTVMIHILGLFAIGLVMLVTGILAWVKGRKHKESYTGTWLGIAGVVIGALFFGFSLFIIIGYLISIGK